MPRILVIDDEEHLLGITRDVLGFEGYDVDTAIDVAEGVAKAKANQPDLILCDWQLPDGTGDDVMAELPEIKMIVVTGSTLKMHEVRHRNFVSYVIKPFHMHMLLTTIRSALEPC